MGVVARQDTPTSGPRHAIKQSASTPTLGSKQRRMSECSSYRTFSEDIPSDITVEAGGTSFCLHKFPLVTRSGRIRRLVAEYRQEQQQQQGDGGGGNGETPAGGGKGVCRISLPDVPGGAEAFELAAKFCYAIGGFEIGVGNVAMLRCAAEYLQMTEEYGGPGNLIRRTEAFINDTVATSLSYCVRVLQSCDGLLPMAEDLRIVARCIDAAAAHACKEQVASSLSQSDFSSSSSSNDSLGSNSTPVLNSTLSGKVSSKKQQPQQQSASWAEELSVLRIGFFRRVLSAMRSRGLRYDCLGGAIVHYAQRSLRGLMVKRLHEGMSHELVKPASALAEHEQRILIETIVSLLPPEKNTASVAFLFGMLRASIYLDTTVACRLDLERRVGLQLEQATLDDLLIPAFSYQGDTLFDVDTVRRIVVNYLQQAECQLDDQLQDPLLSMYASDYSAAGSPAQSSLMKVARLLDCYLAEIAPDANLNAPKFIAIAELMPDHARVVDDGLYRAIDIYLKAHPGVSDMERKKVCARMDIRKLTQEACSHAAQNERLPVQVVVQVLYFEQVRLKSSVMGPTPASSYGEAAQEETALSSKRMGLAAHHHGHGHQAGGTKASLSISPTTDYAAICRENRELKLEMARMRMQFGRPDAPHGHHPQPVLHLCDKLDADEAATSDDKRPALPQQPPSNATSAASQAPPAPTTKPSKFLSSVSKTLGKLNPFSRSSKDSSAVSSSKSGQAQSRRRRHSIS